jgi:hypothetical protein
MEFSQVVFTAKMLLENEHKEERRLYRAAAMIVWHLGAGPKKTFDDYLESIGLSENKKYTNDDKKLAIDKSNAVIKRFEKIRSKNRNDGTV